MRYLSLFSGVGGFEEAIRRVDPEAECVGYSEIDKYAISTYERHFPSHRSLGDATLIDASGLPDFDLLVGGFPCQAFSVAGKRRGFLDDTRGTLFFDIARILDARKPQNFVLENVKGLLSHDGGRTFRTVIETLAGLGYCVEWQVLNSRDFGVPQNRERVYVVGHLGGEPGRKVFPVAGTDVGDHLELAKTLRASKGGASERETLVVMGNPKWGGGERSVEYVLSDAVPTLRATHYKNGDNQPRVYDPPRIRRLTPIECERLQDFPDGWTEGVSDTQRYKQMGNAITVSVAEAVLRNLIGTP